LTGGAGGRGAAVQKAANVRGVSEETQGSKSSKNFDITREKAPQAGQKNRTKEKLDGRGENSINGVEVKTLTKELVKNSGGSDRITGTTGSDRQEKSSQISPSGIQDENQTSHVNQRGGARKGGKQRSSKVVKNGPTCV